MKLIYAFLVALLCSCASNTTVSVRGVSLYLTAPEGQVIIVERHKGGFTNWVPVSNFIGSGTNAAPEHIVTVPTNKVQFFRFRPEL